jgi:hypothetical protein
MYIHCCHCRWCQRESGSAFVLNGLIEATEIERLAGTPETVETPTHSDRGKRIARCLRCKVAVWSNYSAAGEAVCFVRMGTLDDPDRFPPDIHIFTSTKQPWIELSEVIPVVAEYYKRSDHWNADSVARYNAAVGK